MTAKVFCFASAKGGSGKTSLAASFAKFICAIGKQCLIVDCDPATHGLTLLYLNEISEQATADANGLFDLSTDRHVDFEILSNGIAGVENGVHLLPASYRFDATTYSNQPTTPLLPRAIAALRPKYDVILLDAQAGCDDYARLAMSSEVSDEVVLVSEYDPLSAAGVEMMKRVIGDDLSHARTWILLNKILPEFVKNFGEFMSVTKYLPPIPWDANVVRSYAQRKLALELDQGNEFTLAVLQAARRLLGSSFGESIASWVGERAFALKAPLEEQILLARKELDQLTQDRRRNVRRRRMKAIAVTGTLVYVALGLTLYLPYSSFDMVQSELGFVTFALALTTGFAALFVTFWRGFSYDDKDEVLYVNQLAQLEQKFARLETLRDADDETIFREFNASSSASADTGTPSADLVSNDQS